MAATSVPPQRVLVSLGLDCVTATRMRDAGVRAEAFPFDWVVSSSVRGLCTALHERGARHTDTACLEGMQTAAGHWGAYHGAYDLFMMHDIEGTADEDQTTMITSGGGGTHWWDVAPRAGVYEAVRDKYARRWARLVALLDDPHADVHFLRPALRRDEAAPLLDALAACATQGRPRATLTLHTSLPSTNWGGVARYASYTPRIVAAMEGTTDAALHTWGDSNTTSGEGGAIVVHHEPLSEAVVERIMRHGR